MFGISARVQCHAGVSDRPTSRIDDPRTYQEFRDWFPADRDCVGYLQQLRWQEGSTENATLVTDLLVGLRERGLDITNPILVVIDGAARRRSVRIRVTRAISFASFHSEDDW